MPATLKGEARTSQTTLRAAAKRRTTAKGRQSPRGILSSDARALEGTLRTRLADKGSKSWLGADDFRRLAGLR